jgi:DNA-binding protein YbaB
VHSILRKPFDIDVLGDLITAAVKAADEGTEEDAGDILQFPASDKIC